MSNAGPVTLQGGSFELPPLVEEDLPSAVPRDAGHGGGATGTRGEGVATAPAGLRYPGEGTELPGPALGLEEMRARAALLLTAVSPLQGPMQELFMKMLTSISPDASNIPDSLQRPMEWSTSNVLGYVITADQSEYHNPHRGFP
ncbi:unnamed protein product [Lampetra planeri]